MKEIITKIEKDAIIIHIIFIIICMGILLSPIGYAIGIRLFILVIIYNLIIPLMGVFRKYRDWLKIWLFSFILSLFQIWPDWFLSAQLNVLVFPEDGLFKIGTVSGYMLFLWTVPFFIIIFIGYRIQERYSIKTSYMIIALLSLLIFGISEMTIWTLGSWYAQNVQMCNHVALYIIVPEIILGLSAFWFYSITQERKIFTVIPFTFITMLIYLGSAAFFYFLIEQILF